MNFVKTTRNIKTSTLYNIILVKLHWDEFLDLSRYLPDCVVECDSNHGVLKTVQGRGPKLYCGFCCPYCPIYEWMSHLLLHLFRTILHFVWNCWCIHGNPVPQRVSIVKCSFHQNLTVDRLKGNKYLSLLVVIGKCVIVFACSCGFCE